MKKVMIVLSFILAVSLIGCGKEQSEPENAEQALDRIEEDLNAMIESDRQEAEQKEEQGYPEGVIPDGEYICPDATPVIGSMGCLQFTYGIEYDTRNFKRGKYKDSDIGSYTYDSENGNYQFDVYFLTNGEKVNHYEFEGYMDDSCNLVVTYVKTEDEEYNDLEWVYVRQ
ncbi:MAG: hypothetical protein NC092_02065 [Butyrivibrio sp.]|nr:hypothetical protein [Butyrivibrio sp.]